jgi:hypothetical protein
MSALTPAEKSMAVALSKAATSSGYGLLGGPLRRVLAKAAVAHDTTTAPDWAEVREAARAAGWTSRRDRDEPRVRIWGRYSNDRMYADYEHGWARVYRTRRVLVVDLAGPSTEGGHQTAHLINPTPARVLTIARLVGLGGHSDER